MREISIKRMDEIIKDKRIERARYIEKLEKDYNKLWTFILESDIDVSELMN